MFLFHSILEHSSINTKHANAFQRRTSNTEEEEYKSYMMLTRSYSQMTVSKNHAP